MRQNILLTSIIAISFAMPAMATIQSGSTCDTTNLGQSENNSTANVEATWTANTYNISYICADGTDNTLSIGGQAILSCSNSNNGTCLNPTIATYGEFFKFAGSRQCAETGYTFTNWACTDSNNNTRTFNSEQIVNSWNIASNLTCVEQRTANTINIDWNPKNGEQHTLNTCTYGQTITLPQQPSKTGYTFNGWNLIDTCPDLNSQETCNADDSCIWIGESCINLNSDINGCANEDNFESCSAKGYCNWDITTNECTTADYHKQSVLPLLG